MQDDPRVPEILDIVARETGADRAALRPEARIEDLGIASLDMVQAIFALETRFEVEIPAVTERQGSAEFATVGALLSHVLAAIDAAKASPAGAG